MGRIPSCMVKTKIFAALTENGASNAWNLNLSDGKLNNWNAKVKNAGHVHAVSALNIEVYPLIFFRKIK